MHIELVEKFKRATERPRSAVESEDMEWFGIRNLMRTAKAYNLLRSGRTSLHRARLYRSRWPELAAADGPPAAAPVVMQDGWAIDTSLSNPHLPRLLQDAEQVIAERGMTIKGALQDRRFIRDILQPQDLETYPSFLDFVTSPDVVATVTRYMRQIPVLSNTVPPGVRFVESSADGQVDDVYRTSQLYHLDFHDFRAVYVIVLLRDATPESGPFTFLGAESSARVTRELGYRRRHAPYHLSDEQVHGVVDRSEAMPFVYPKGTILYLDSNRCFHFGSRDATRTRYQLMCAYVTPARADFTETRMTPRVYPVRPEDSELRRLLLDRHHRTRSRPGP